MDVRRMGQIKKAATKWATIKGYSDQSDDFASFVLLQIVKTKPDRLYLSNWFVDFKRELYGDSRRTKVHSERHSGKRPMRYHTPLSDAEKVYTEWVDTLLDVPKKQFNRAVVVLSVKWGLKNKEIAEVFGVTSARISQIFNDIARSENGSHNR